jgi:hypothetical protein
MRADDLHRALRMFAHTYGKHDARGTLEWFKYRLADPSHLFLITDHHVSVGCVTTTFYWPGFLQCYSLFLFGDELAAKEPWATLKLLRALIAWGRSQGARRFHLSSELGQADLTPLATRLGMTRDMPHFRMEL